MIKILIFTLICKFVWGQEIPQDFIEYEIQNLTFDQGNNWPNNTIFGPPRNLGQNYHGDALRVNGRFGGIVFNSHKAVYGYGHFSYKKYFRGYLYPRVVDNPKLFSRFSGLEMDIDRFGFTSGETDLSGISFENDWIILQLGRGRESWGAGNNSKLAISEKSNPYDYGMIDLDFGHLRVRYFHGYLETDSVSINRYITGRGIEWNNHKNFLFGISEIVIYSGFNRPVDFSYFNPISTHLEIELNGRQNKLGTDSGNGVWQLSFDRMFLKNWRLSFNYLIDEFIMDKEQKDRGKKSSTAFSLKNVYTPQLDLNSIISIYFLYTYVGKNTFSHEDGNNNFVHRGKPLGLEIGNDTRNIKVGFVIFEENKLLTKLSSGFMKKGHNNFIENPYKPYSDFNFGISQDENIERITYLNLKIQSWPRENISIMGIYNFSDSNILGRFSELSIGIDFFYNITGDL